MPKPDKSNSRDYREFRFRLRHDHLLRHRLRQAKQEAVISIARDLGFNLTHEDLQKQKRADRRTGS